MNLHHIRQFCFFMALAISIVACTKSVKNRADGYETIKGTGFIVSTNVIANRLLDNNVFYFVPVNKMDTIFPLLSFRDSILKEGFGFVLNSKYYSRLIYAAGVDITAYIYYPEKKDFERLEFECRKILPVNLEFEYKKENFNSILLKDSVLFGHCRRTHFKYRLVGDINIKKLEVRLRKDIYDIEPNMQTIPIKYYGISGGVSHCKTTNN